MSSEQWCSQQRINDLKQPIGPALDNWSPRPRPPRTTMSGRYCRVEPLQPQHAGALFEAFGADSDGRNWTYMPYGPFEDFDSFERWLQQQCQGEDPLFYCIIDNATDQPVGMASYLRIEPAVGVIEVGHIHFSPRLQRTALATETMYLMMRRVFDELGYRRYEWKCDSLNEPSRQAAKRLGFQFEGVFRQATIYKGRNRDTAWFSILDSEWPRLKSAFEQWLAPQNFDANGEQQQRLQAFLD
ncbi:N-acetyltransferase [Motiliproteus coralliicola]|uniref:N-acetyltransferase n=1 Tax=Motiliproteus coralliicola TaxID=2283196 RepID=A0A369WEK5_9GAMM|nr:GNAT family protein [Motiliproteus coralliicola]RDE19046.1 N-acetyltransferase [Motiliproteus coralliicola]